MKSANGVKPEFYVKMSLRAWVGTVMLYEDGEVTRKIVDEIL